MAHLVSSEYKKLIGTWKTTGQVITGTQTLTLEGTDSYEFVLDGQYILHQANVVIGNDPVKTFEMIGGGNSADTVAMHYFNSKGETGIMTGRITANDFQITGSGIRFEGSFNSANTMVTGKWFKQSDDNTWIAFIDLRLEKM